MKVLLLPIFLSLICVRLSFADTVVVVVSSNSMVQTLDKSTVIDIFMGRYIAYPDGSTALPLEIVGSGSLRQEFYRKLVGMSIPKVNAYWSRLKFSGRQRPTIEKTTELEVVNFIALNNSAIGYVYKSTLTPDLRVVLELNE